MIVVQIEFFTKRTIGAALAVVLVLTAPGPGAYAAVVRTVVRVRAAGVPGGLAGGGVGAAGATRTGFSPFTRGSGFSLGAILPSVNRLSAVIGRTTLPDAAVAGARSSTHLTALIRSQQVPGAVAPGRAPPEVARKRRPVPIFQAVFTTVRRLASPRSAPGNRSAVLGAIFDQRAGSKPVDAAVPSGRAFGRYRGASLAPDSAGRDSRNGLRHRSPVAPDLLSDGIPPAVEADPRKGASEGRPLFKLGRYALFFIAAMTLAQLASVAVGAAMPALIQKSFGDFAATVTHLTIMMYGMDFLGRQIAPLTIRRLGLKKTFLAAHSLKFVFMGALAALLGADMMTLPLLQVFVLASTFMGAITATVEQSIPPALVGRSAAALEHYWTREQIFRSLISIGGPIATGAVIMSFGFFPAFLTFPIATAFAIAIVWKLVKIIPRLDKIAAADILEKVSKPKNPPAKTRKERLKERFGLFTRGARLVWNNPALRTSALAMAVFTMAGTLTFILLVPAYGLLLAGPGMEELAAGIYGWIIGLFNLGGLLGVFSAMYSQRKMAKRVRDRTLPQEEVDKILMRSMLRWMLWGTLGLAALATFAIPLPALGALTALPGFLSWAGNITLPALAFIPQGFVMVLAVMKLRSFFQSRVPSQDDMPDAMGFLGVLALVFQAAALFSLKYLFTSFTGTLPFIYVSFGLVPLAGLFLWMRMNLRKHGLGARVQGLAKDI